MKVQLEASNLQAKGEAEGVAGKLNGKSFMVTRQASETGQLYGSVSARDIAMLLSEGGFTVARNQIALNNPIKMVGLHKLAVALHPEVEVSITINVARNADEAERQARGEDVTQRREGEDDEAAVAAEAAAAVFEKPELAPGDDQGSGAEEKTAG
jgi:large subunit ribosomal protein L9